MHKLSLKQQLFLLVGALMATLLIVGAMGLRGMMQSADDLKDVYENRLVPVLLLKRVSDAYAVEVVDSTQKVHDRLLPWEEAVERLRLAEAEAKSAWEAYLKTEMTADELKTIDELKPLLQRAGLTTAHLSEVIRARDRTALEGLLAGELYQSIDPLTGKLNEAIHLQEEVARSTHDKVAAAEETMIRSFGIVLSASVVIGLFFAYLILRGINAKLAQMMDRTERLAGGDLSVRIGVTGEDELGRLGQAFNRMADSLQALVGKVQRSGIQVASSATEIAASVKAQQATSTEQAATTNQIVASAREIASTSKVLVKNMDEVAHVADSTSRLAEDGREDLTRMEATMNQMMEATRGIASRLAVLSEKAGNINAVVTTINKVADQTNLLSLNAAIEAEKAGEHGIGFGVVATEIRRLADQTAVATWDIEQMVKEMQSAVSSGVMGMEKFSEEVRHGVEQVGQVGERLAKIVKSVQLLTPHFESVYEAMQAQSAGAEQINEALEQLRQTVQGTAEAMRESAQVVDQLNEASQRLQASVASFKVAG